MEKIQSNTNLQQQLIIEFKAHKTASRQTELLLNYYLRLAANLHKNTNLIAL